MFYEPPLQQSPLSNTELLSVHARLFFTLLGQETARVNCSPLRRAAIGPLHTLNDAKRRFTFAQTVTIRGDLKTA